METLKITIDDEQTKQLVVRLLHQIKGVTALKELSGIWAGRDVTITELRDKAWRVTRR